MPSFHLGKAGTQERFSLRLSSLIVNARLLCPPTAINLPCLSRCSSELKRCAFRSCSLQHNRSEDSIAS